MLKQAKASEKVVNKFVKDTQTLKIPFAQIVQAVRAQEEKSWIARKLNQNVSVPEEIRVDEQIDLLDNIDETRQLQDQSSAF